MKERRQCACRVVIEADPVPEAIEHAVQVHQKQPEHVVYQVLTQLRGDYVAPQKMAGMVERRMA